MAVLDGPSNVPSPGYVEIDDGPVAWIADNRTKGISDIPALTIHASPDFSERNWDRDREEAGRDLLSAAAPWLGSGVVETSVHEWRYARPERTYDATFARVSDHPPLLIAGDAFVAARVEGAAISGRAAAASLLSAP